MRWLVLILLLADLIYLGWELDRTTRIGIVNAAASVPVPAGAARLELIGEFGRPPPRKKTWLPERPPPAEEVLVESLPEIGTAAEPAAPASFSCFTYGPMPDERQAEWLSDWFRARGGETRSRASKESGRQLFWIYLAPERTRESALAVMAELERKGVRDTRLIGSGDLRNAVSLGLFSSQAAVNARLGELNEKGYHPVVVPYMNLDKFFWVDVRVPAVPALLGQIFDGYPSRFNSVPRSCAEIALLSTTP